MSIEAKENVTSAIKELKKELSDSQKNRLVQIEAIVVEDVKTAFNEKKSVDGQVWKPATPASKKRGFDGDLKKSGKLFNSFKKGAKKPGEITFKSKLEYDQVHQFGSTKFNIPARPFLPITSNELSEETKQKIMKALEKILDDAIKLGESKIT